MLRYIYGHNLDQFPSLRDSMYRDRASQFKGRLNWDVSVDDQGFERDQYDDLNPLYVMWELPDGHHGGSARFLPTTGRTMVNEHFLHLTDGVAFRSPFIWECTRFCLSPDAPARAATAIMLGGGELMRAFNVQHFIGVFDIPMLRIYRRIGSSPEVLGTAGEGRRAVAVGIWHYTNKEHHLLLERAGVSVDQSELWFGQSFDRRPVVRQDAPALLKKLPA